MEHFFGRDAEEDIYVILDPSVLLTLPSTRFIYHILTPEYFYISRTLVDFILSEKIGMREFIDILRFFKQNITHREIKHLQSAILDLQQIFSRMPKKRIYSSSPEKLRTLFEKLKGYDELKKLYPDTLSTVDLIIEDYYMSKGTLRQTKLGILIDELSFILENSEILVKTKTLIKNLRKYMILAYDLTVNKETRKLLKDVIRKKISKLLVTLKHRKDTIIKKVRKHHKTIKRYANRLGLVGTLYFISAVKEINDIIEVETQGIHILIIPLLIKVLDP